MKIRERNPPAFLAVGTSHVCLHGHQDCKGNAGWVEQARKTVCKNFTGKCPEEKLSQKSYSGEIPGLHSIPNPDPPLPVARLCCLAPLVSLLAEKAQKQLTEIKNCDHCVRLSPRPTLFQEECLSPGPARCPSPSPRIHAPADEHMRSSLSSFPIAELEPERSIS